MFTEIAFLASVGGVIYCLSKFKNGDIMPFLKEINADFGCKFYYGKATNFIAPDYNTAYILQGKKYISYKTLEYKECEETSEQFENNTVKEYIDEYGNKVISIIKNIPCFDSGDREYDSSHILYFFQQSNRIYALYCKCGYRIATMVLFKNIVPINTTLKELLKNKGFTIG